MKNKKSVNKKYPFHPGLWVAIGIVIIIAVIILFFSRNSSIDVSSDKIAQGLVELYTSQGIANFSLISVEKVSGLYQFNFIYQGKPLALYSTLDGKFLGTMADMPPAVLESKIEASTGTTDLISCLAQKKVKIYGASWCGYTQSFVNSLGGFSKVSPIYVDCDKETSLCSKENIPGYPTIKIDGKVYSGSRDLAVFTNYVGC